MITAVRRADSPASQSRRVWSSFKEREGAGGLCVHHSPCVLLIRPWMRHRAGSSSRALEFDFLLYSFLLAADKKTIWLLAQRFRLKAFSPSDKNRMIPQFNTKRKIWIEEKWKKSILLLLLLLCLSTSLAQTHAMISDFARELQTQG